MAINKNGERRIYAYSGAANLLSTGDIKREDLVKSKIIFLSSLRNITPFKKAAKIAKKNNIPIILNPGMLIIEQGFDNIKQLLSFTDILIISKREFQNLFQFKEKKLELPLIEEKAKNLFRLGKKK